MGIILPQLIYGGKKISILYHYFPWSLLHGASLPIYEWKMSSTYNYHFESDTYTLKSRQHHWKSLLIICCILSFICIICYEI